MKKKISVIVILFTIVLVITLNYGQPMKYIVENDGEIEWHTYEEEILTCFKMQSK